MGMWMLHGRQSCSHCHSWINMVRWIESFLSMPIDLYWIVATARIWTPNIGHRYQAHGTAKCQVSQADWLQRPLANTNKWLRMIYLWHRYVSNVHKSLHGARPIQFIVCDTLRCYNCCWQTAIFKRGRGVTVTSHGRHVVSNHRQLDCLFNRWLKLTQQQSIGDLWSPLTKAIIQLFHAITSYELTSI